MKLLQPQVQPHLTVPCTIFRWLGCGVMKCEAAAADDLMIGEDSRLADPFSTNFLWSGPLLDMTEVLETNPESLGDAYSAYGICDEAYNASPYMKLVGQVCLGKNMH